MERNFANTTSHSVLYFFCSVQVLRSDWKHVPLSSWLRTVKRKEEECSSAIGICVGSTSGIINGNLQLGGKWIIKASFVLFIKNVGT